MLLCGVKVLSCIFVSVQFTEITAVLCTTHPSQLQRLTLLSKTPRFLVGWLVWFLTWHKQTAVETRRPNELEHEVFSPNQIFTLIPRENPLLWLFQSRLQHHPMSKEEPAQPAAFAQTRHSHLTQCPEGAMKNPCFLTSANMFLLLSHYFPPIFLGLGAATTRILQAAV